MYVFSKLLQASQVCWPTPKGSCRRYTIHKFLRLGAQLNTPIGTRDIYITFPNGEVSSQYTGEEIYKLGNIYVPRINIVPNGFQS